MKLIDEWRSCLKFFSVQANALGFAITGTYAAMYSEIRDVFPPKLMFAVTAGVFILGILGRLVSQTPKEESK